VHGIQSLRAVIGLYKNKHLLEVGTKLFLLQGDFGGIFNIFFFFGGGGDIIGHFD